MKKYIGFFVLGIAMIGFLFLLTKPASNPAAQNSKNKFFDPSEIMPDDVVIRITDQGFEPETVVVRKSQRVVWVNESPDFAWPASNPHPTHSFYQGFDPLEPLDQGEAWAFTFTEAGNWGMHDHLRPGKRGTIRVNE